PTPLDAESRERLARNGVRVVETPISALEGDRSGPRRLRFADGGKRPCRAVFLMPEGGRPSELMERLG
ncbi:hypothetical protein, partial [Stenotrophomonas maltophilia]